MKQKLATEENVPTRVGYARVSTPKQSTSAQLEMLKAAGCVRVFEDTASGARDDRTGLASALDYLRPGDCLVVTKLDRLGRGLRSLINFVDELRQKGIGLISLNDGIDTSKEYGTILMTLIASFAEMERNLILERTSDGVARARDRGAKFGRKVKLDGKLKQKASDLLMKGVSPREVASLVGVSRATLYRHLPGAKGERA